MARAGVRRSAVMRRTPRRCAPPISASVAAAFCRFRTNSRFRSGGVGWGLCGAGKTSRNISLNGVLCPGASVVGGALVGHTGRSPSPRIAQAEEARYRLSLWRSGTGQRLPRGSADRVADGCAGPSGASTTTSPAATSAPTPARWSGGRTLGAARTSPCTSSRPARRSATRCRACGRGTGSARRRRDLYTIDFTHFVL